MNNKSLMADVDMFSPNLKTNYERLAAERKAALQDLREIPINTGGFGLAVTRLQQATKDFEKGLQRAGDQIRAITSTVRLYTDFAQHKRRKLARKAKKKYIKRHGRAFYHKTYHRPGIALMINSLGGVIG